MSNYVAGLCHLCTKEICMQVTKAFVAETSCNQLLIDTAIYVFALNQFAYSEDHSNEPLENAMLYVCG